VLNIDAVTLPIRRPVIMIPCEVPIGFSIRAASAGNSIWLLLHEVPTSVSYLLFAGILAGPSVSKNNRDDSIFHLLVIAYCPQLAAKTLSPFDSVLVTFR